MLCSRLSAITGSITLSWKLPDWPAIVIVASLPMTCAATIADGLGDHRIHLARHDAAAGLQRRQRDLAEAASGPLFIQRRSFAIFIRLTAVVFELPGHLDRRVLRAHRLEEVVERVEADARALRERGRERAPNSGCALMPVPTAVPPCARPVSRGSAPLSLKMLLRSARPSRRSPDRASPASHPSGACGRSSRCRRPTSPSCSIVSCRCSSAGSSSLRDRERRAHVDRGRDHVVAALAHVDVIVRMHGLARALASRAARSPRSRSCSCWCPSPSGTRRSGTARRACRPRPRARPSGSPSRSAPAAGSRLLFASAAAHLIEPERADERGRHRQAADREVLDGALRLRAPERGRRHLQLAHAVALDAELGRHAYSSNARQSESRRSPTKRV